MEIRELALLLFTFFMQAAIGTLIALLIVEFFTRREGVHEDRPSSLKRYMVVPVMALVGILASFGHLGRIMHAPFILKGVTSSGLSQEVAVAALFFVVVLVLGVLAWLGKVTRGGRLVLALIGSIVGLLLLFLMANAYAIRTVPVWDNLGTYLITFLAAFILGPIIAGVLLAITERGPVDADTLSERPLRLLSVISLVAAVLLVIVYALRMAFFASEGTPGAEVFGSQYFVLLLVRLALPLIASIGFFVSQTVRKERVVGLSTLVLLLLIACVGEILGRYLFYATFLRVGI